MGSLTDIARAHGAGPVQAPIYHLEKRVVRAAQAYVDACEQDNKTALRERALHEAVRALEGALESAEQCGKNRR